MKFIKFLLFLCVAIANGICATDLKKNPDLPTEVQLKIAKKIVNPIIAYIKKQPIHKNFAKVGEHGPSSITFSYDGTKLAVAEFGRVLIFDVKTHKFKELKASKTLMQKFLGLFSSPKSSKGWAFDLAFNRDGNRLAVWLKDGIEIWDLDKDDIVRKIEFKSRFKPMIAKLKFDANSTQILAMTIASSGHQKIHLWNIATGILLNIKTIKNIHLIGKPISKFKNRLLSPDNSKLAIYKYLDGAIDIVDVKTKTLIKKIQTIEKNMLISDPVMAFSSPSGAAIAYVVSKETGRKIPAPVDGIEMLIIEGEEDVEQYRLEREELERWIQISFAGKKEQALQWLAESLRPVQAEIIRKAYESHVKGKSLAITGVIATREFNAMPHYVRDLLQFYLGLHVDAQAQKFFEEQSKRNDKER